MVVRLRSVARFTRRYPRFLLLACHVYALLILMRGVIRVFPLRRITRHLGTPMRETSHDDVTDAQLLHARRVGWLIRKLAPHTPTDSNCYPQALTARWLLHRKGIPTTIYYGAALEPARPKLAAHVWLRAGPLTVTGGATGRRFEPLSSFADTPAARHPRGRASSF